MSNERIIAAAAQVLSEAWTTNVQLGSPMKIEGGSGGSILLRCQVQQGAQKSQQNVVVKATHREGDNFDERRAGLLNDWASLAFLSQSPATQGLAPRFYGGNLVESLIVMEDLGVGESLVEPLLGTDPVRAVNAIDTYFRSLGRLNALTCGRYEQYQHIRTSLGPIDEAARPTLDQVNTTLGNNLHDLADRLDVEIPAAVKAEIVEAARFDAEPGLFLAFSQSDTCPDNCVRRGDSMRFFDFEGGWFRHALSDGARARSNFPTCWCVGRLPHEIIRRAEAVYRSELVKGCPDAADDELFGREIVKACAFWTLYSFDFYRHFDFWAEDAAWGTTSVRQRIIARFELLAQATGEFGYLEALGECAESLASTLQQRWPETEPMPLYPAFRTGIQGCGRV